MPIRRPMIIDKKIKGSNSRDSEILIKVGLHISTIICADHTSTPTVPKNMTDYTDSEIRINGAFCKAYSGRMLRHNAVVKPARHSVAWINVNSLMMGQNFEEVHQKMHCGLGPQSYINGINLAGFCATGLTAYSKEHIDACQSCIEAKMVMKGASQQTHNIKQFYGPDDFIASTKHL